MKLNTVNSTRIIIPVAFFFMGAFAGWFGASTIQDSVGVLPISTCESDCIKSHKNDPQARLNCMLKCIADGK